MEHNWNTAGTLSQKSIIQIDYEVKEKVPACVGQNLLLGPLVLSSLLQELKKILPRSNTGRIRFTDYITGKGEPLFEKLEALNLEGMVVKRQRVLADALSRLVED